MTTLYVTDLDGTLLNTHDKIDEYSIRTINRLVEEGMLFTYATARSLNSSLPVTKGLSTKIPVIIYNGGKIVQPSTGKLLHSVAYTEDEQKQVITFLKEKEIFPLVYAYIDGAEQVSWIPKYENEGFCRYLNNRKGDKRLRPVETEQELYRGDIFYFTCIGEKEELEPVYHAFEKKSAYQCTLQQELYRPEYWCEVMPAKATKAHAIEKMKELYQCDRVVSFGDSINDLPMFRISDECYAVENAAEELKSQATGIIGDNNHGSVAKWLEENFSKGS